MPHEIDEDLQLAAQNIRNLVRGRNVLYHGTRHPRAVLEDSALRSTLTRSTEIWFSRSAEEAIFWATLPRDNDEGCGAILIFDRDRLASCYRLHLLNMNDEIDEQEEAIIGREVRLCDGLVGYVPVPESAEADEFKEELLESQRLRIPDDESKRKIVDELEKPGADAATVARGHGIDKLLLLSWRRQFRAIRKRAQRAA